MPASRLPAAPTADATPERGVPVADAASAGSGRWLTLDGEAGGKRVRVDADPERWWSRGYFPHFDDINRIQSGG